MTDEPGKPPPLMVPVIANAEDGTTQFLTQSLATTDVSGMDISERQSTSSFRYRKSRRGYQTDWHVAGDPTLIVVCRGKLKIELKNGDCRVFGPGDKFIAADRSTSDTLGEGIGHRASVVGPEALEAVHIKLTNFSLP